MLVELNRLASLAFLSDHRGKRAFWLFSCLSSSVLVFFRTQDGGQLERDSPLFSPSCRHRWFPAERVVHWLWNSPRGEAWSSTDSCMRQLCQCPPVKRCGICFRTWAHWIETGSGTNWGPRIFLCSVICHCNPIQNRNKTSTIQRKSSNSMQTVYPLLPLQEVKGQKRNFDIQSKWLESLCCLLGSRRMCFRIVVCTVRRENRLVQAGQPGVVPVPLRTRVLPGSADSSCPRYKTDINDGFRKLEQLVHLMESYCGQKIDLDALWFVLFTWSVNLLSGSESRVRSMLQRNHWHYATSGTVITALETLLCQC